MKNNFSISGYLKSGRLGLSCAYVFFALISIFVYFNALHNGFLYDDKFFVVRNLYIRSLNFIPYLFKIDAFHFAPSPSDYYRPVQLLSYALDYFFWKLNPFGYHLDNILIHSVNSFLVFLLVWRIFKDIFLALLSAVFFCVHPIHIGAVTVIGGRSNILEMMFMLLSLLALLRYYLDRQIPAYLLSLSLFILAVLSREGALLEPFFIILCALVLKVDKKKIAYSLLPFLAIGLFYLIWRSHFMPSDKLRFQGIFSWPRLSAFFYLCQSYVAQLILPIGVAIRILPQKLISSLILVSLSLGYSLAALALAISKNKIALFGLVFYFFGLAPVLNLIGHISSLGRIISEPYVYLASVGFFIILAYFLLKAYARFPKTSGFGIALIILFYGSLTVANNLNYRDEESFYNYLLSADQKNTIAHLNLGNIYLKKRMFAQAEKESRVVLKIEPDAWDAYLLLGNISKEKGDLAGAAKLYERALILKPGSTEALNNLGLIYMAQGSDAKAIGLFKEAIAISPDSLVAMQNLADILIAKKSYQEALELCDKILKLDPEDISAQVKIGIILAESGRIRQAESVFKEALKLDPNSVEALRNLGVLYANAGYLDKAMAMWEKALSINPDDKETLKNIQRAKTIKDSKGIKPR